MLSMCAVGVYKIFFAAEKSEKPNEESISYRSKQIAENGRRAKRARTRVLERKVREKAEKPRLLDLNDEEEAKLNAYSRKILSDLQEALDSENFGKVRSLVRKMLEIPPDPKFGAEGVSKLLRRSAVEAMGWFGAKGIPELAGLLADADPDIAQSAFDQFDLALQDITLSDYERADIISLAAKALTDVDGLEMLFMEINNMRNSVAAGLLVDICLNGTEAAKGLMPDQIEFVTGEDNIVSVEDIENWLKNNPDGPDDDDLYGGFDDT